MFRNYVLDVRTRIFNLLTIYFQNLELTEVRLSQRKLISYFVYLEFGVDRGSRFISTNKQQVTQLI